MTEPDEDREVDEWLAAATGSTPEEVHRELEEGERRRDFVADELIDAGFAGPPLLDGVMRLTGLEEAEARALIARRTKEVS
jgi:hypothetical protein